MFNQAVFEKSSQIENRGTVLEHEYFNSVNKNRYSDLVESYQNPGSDVVRTREDAERIMIRKYAEKQAYIESFRNDSYINFKDSMGLVEKCQPGNPENPSAFFAGALRKKISDLLGDQYIIKFFTAVGSHLDTKHGVDAFLKIYDKEGRELGYVTLDISSRDKGGCKANHLILVSGEQRDKYDSGSDIFDKKEFFSRIDGESRTIVSLILDRIEKNKKFNSNSFNDEKRVARRDYQNPSRV